MSKRDAVPHEIIARAVGHDDEKLPVQLAAYLIGGGRADGDYVETGVVPIARNENRVSVSLAAERNSRTRSREQLAAVPHNADAQVRKRSSHTETLEAAGYHPKIEGPKGYLKSAALGPFAQPFPCCAVCFRAGVQSY